MKKPKTIPREQRRMFRAPDLQGMLQVLQVQVTLVHNNHPNIAITADKRQVRYEVHQTRNLQHECEIFREGILGYPAIQSGKHYWEVDVSGKDSWVLGLSNGNYLSNPVFHSHAERDPFFGGGIRNDFQFSLFHPSPSLLKGLRNDSHYQPKCCFWVIGLLNKSVYNAFEECPFTGNPRVLTLSLMVPPCRVGVFLDYAAGTLSFYNISNNGTLIYRFCTASFSDRVFPYFNPMRSPEPMTICWPDS